MDIGQQIKMQEVKDPSGTQEQRWNNQPSKEDNPIGVTYLSDAPAYEQGGKLRKMPQIMNNLPVICGRVEDTGDLTNPSQQLRLQ
uniref:Uncharacterized protein n=1 Tax=Oryza nivara TaxID=4536 RepID=A0A0E0FG98_ORYNI